jgi:hypothetical protein
VIARLTTRGSVGMPRRGKTATGVRQDRSGGAQTGDQNRPSKVGPPPDIKGY